MNPCEHSSLCRPRPCRTCEPSRPRLQLNPPGRFHACRLRRRLRRPCQLPRQQRTSRPNARHESNLRSDLDAKCRSVVPGSKHERLLLMIIPLLMPLAAWFVVVCFLSLSLSLCSSLISLVSFVMSTRRSTSQARKRNSSAHKRTPNGHTQGDDNKAADVARASASSLELPDSPLQVQEFHGEHAVSYRYSLGSTAGLSSVARSGSDSSSSSSSSQTAWSMPSLSRWWQSLSAFACSLFLPLGYPASVTPDYLEVRAHTHSMSGLSEASVACSLCSLLCVCVSGRLQFQVWDTIQAMCSYLRGMLCTHAVLTGMGVGEVTSTLDTP